MAKSTFTKLAATPQQLLQKLKDQGLVVSAATESQALAYLNGVGAYRLKGYWFHLVDPATKQFPAGYTFERIANRCELDREVRAATIEAIDRLEVAIRAVIANHLSLKHSPHWFLNSAVFRPTDRWGMGQLIGKIEQEVSRAKEKRFVAYYFERHDDPYLPPSWAISECVSFSMWSRTYAILRDPNDKKAICKRFGIDQVEVFQSWIHTLAYVRNLVAHHGQLLNVQLRVPPTSYKLANIKFNDPKSFHAVATVIQFLLKKTGLPHRWQTDLEAIFKRYPCVDPLDLGFSPRWADKPGW